jgi:hypothetical protein
MPRASRPKAFCQITPGPASRPPPAKNPAGFFADFKNLPFFYFFVKYFYLNFRNIFPGKNSRFCRFFEGYSSWRTIILSLLFPVCQVFSKFILKNSSGKLTFYKKRCITTIEENKMKKIIVLAAILLNSVFVHSQNFDFGNFQIPGGQSGPASNPTMAKGMAKAEDAEDKMNGLIPMRFYSALNRAPIAGGSVEIPNVGTVTTNSAGKIAFPKLRDGNYTLIFSKEGYITTPIDFRVLLGAVDLNWYSISPGIPNKDYRIVLDWAEKPADLDIHFVKTNGYHISYFNLHNAEDGNAVLDRDDTGGYGPETITIGNIDLRATYTCYVHDYTNRSNTNSTQMAKEGAIIRVYSQNKLMHSFRIPANGVGTTWNVFKIERGGIVPVNTVTK